MAPTKRRRTATGETAVKKAKLSQSTTNQIANDQQERRSILSLNDDCLLEVFSHMPMTDLCTIKDCCRRFSVLAESTVQKRCRPKKNGTFLTKDQYVDVEDGLYPKKFERVISHLRVPGSLLRKWPGGLDAMLKNCTSLKGLFLDRVELSRISGRSKILHQIEDLHIDDESSNNSQLCKVINACTMLKNLCIDMSYYHAVSDDLIECINEKSSVESVYWMVSNSHACGKIQKIIKLKKVRLMSPMHGCICSAYVHDIDSLQKCNSLEELVLYDVRPSDGFLSTLNKFPNLKKLELCSTDAFVCDLIGQKLNANMALLTNFEIEKSTDLYEEHRVCCERSFKYIITPKLHN